jgi:hypothetical protein
MMVGGGWSGHHIQCYSQLAAAMIRREFPLAHECVGQVPSWRFEQEKSIMRRPQRPLSRTSVPDDQ